MRKGVPQIEHIGELIRRVDGKYQPAWHGRPAKEQAAIALYFLPHGSSKGALNNNLDNFF